MSACNSAENGITYGEKQPDKTPGVWFCGIARKSHWFAGGEFWSLYAQFRLCPDKAHNSESPLCRKIQCRYRSICGLSPFHFPQGMEEPCH